MLVRAASFAMVAHQKIHFAKSNFKNQTSFDPRSTVFTKMDI
jgi:hypothetical protein